MRYSNLAILAAATAVSAQRPEDESICDYYTKALLKENTAKNQATLLTLVVNTASTNRNNKAVSVNFLDGGGAAPLQKNMAADNDKSNQYFLLTHLYEFFGSLLGCSQQGMSGFAAYTADPSMYDVHKFMNLNDAEMTYFITQVGMSAASFGVAEADVTAVGESLGKIFNVRCAPAAEVIKAQGPQLQSICIADDCPLAENAVCDKYDKAVEPQPASSSNATASGTSTVAATGTGMKPTGTGTSTGAPGTVETGAAAAHGLSVAALIAGLAAFAL
ncbi:hypothetical protein NLU13_2555 [Sarocladium strictum]|uniref:Secreted protein n=1 Tax=Sarocladium strictum TaxID=5046 RepID=A0AA39GLU3_SARSR|nr:hypothetical protein NLU13_2555 [Sarocladium strictum]